MQFLLHFEWGLINDPILLYAKRLKVINSSYILNGN
jgi:hypothetical protein